MMKNRYLNYIEHGFLKIKLSNSSGVLLKRLGYPRGTKLLIIHADDLGLSSSENLASVVAMKEGMINSGSVIALCPKFNEITGILRSNPEIDIGIHLTLTCEWKSYQWKPILPASEVPSIVDSNGYLFENHLKLLEKFDSADIEREFRAQINLVIESGIVPTHFDSHMFTVFRNPIIQRIYISLGKEFKVPVLLNKDRSILNSNFDNEILVNGLYIAKPVDYAKSLDSFYRKTLLSLKSGLNSILVHPAYDDTEMKNITLNEINYGSNWRQADFNFFTGNDCQEIIKNNDIRLITWREIRDKLLR
jgi:chitin disaccharide deacetylase